MSIKERIRRSGLYQWEIAEAVGINEVTLCRWLRRPERLQPEQVAKLEAAIQKVKAQKGAR